MNSKQMGNFSTVVFDLGGVLVDWNPRYLYRKVFKDESKMEWFLTNICTHEWNEQHDAGVSWELSTDKLVKEHPAYEKEIRMYRKRWEEMVGGPIQENVDLLKNIQKSGYQILALTNWSADTFTLARKKFEFLSWFSGIVVSGEIGLIKPDPKIFEYLIQTHEIDPKKSIYIDDVIKNVDAAKKIGFQALHCQSPTQLKREISSLIKL